MTIEDWRGLLIGSLAVVVIVGGLNLVGRQAAAEAPQVSMGSIRGIPLVLDYDGDGVADTALWDGVYFHVRLAATAWQSGPMVQWGSSGLGDIPATGDFDGDGRDDLAVFRSANGQACWYVKSAATGAQIGPWQFNRGQPWANLPLVACPVYGE